VNETHPGYGGVYAGEGSQPDVKERVEASDLILTIGAIKVRPLFWHEILQLIHPI
jgi:pyruvate decarboxylase